MIEDWTGLVPQGIKARFYPHLDSTNLEGERLVRSGLAETFSRPLWIVTADQTAGRGRLGREWRSLSGNLFCSLVIHPFWPVDCQNFLPFAVGLGVAATVKKLINDSRFGDLGDVSLKWPNDVLIKGQKVAGILIERPSPSSPFVIGIGLNLTRYPDNMVYPATSLAKYWTVWGKSAAVPCIPDHNSLDQRPEDDRQALLNLPHVFSILAYQVKSYLKKLTAENCFPLPTSVILEEWLSGASGFGERRMVTIKGVKTPATLVGLNDKGGLIVKLDDNQKTILYAGDVFDLVP